VLVEHERQRVAPSERSAQSTSVVAGLNGAVDAACAARGPERLKRADAEAAGHDEHRSPPQACVGESLELA